MKVSRETPVRSMSRAASLGIALATLLGHFTALAQPVPAQTPEGNPIPPAATAPDAVPAATTLTALVDAGELQLTLVGVNAGDDVELRMRNTAGRALRVQFGPGATTIEIQSAAAQLPIVLHLDGGAGMTLDLAPGGTASLVVPQLGNSRLESGSVALSRSERAYQASKFAFSGTEPQRPSPLLAMAPCVPACAQGSACFGGQCSSLCAPACPAGQACTDEGKCTAPSAAAPAPAPTPPAQSAPAPSYSTKNLGSDEPHKDPEEGWRRHRIEAGYFGGWGVDPKVKIADVQVATTTLGVTTNSVESIYTRFGGGNGFLLTYGFSPIQQLELTLSLGGQWTGIDEGQVEPAKGNFGRGLSLLSAYYVVPFAAHGHGPTFLIGAGGGLHHSGKLDSDLTEIPGGTHSVLTFEPSFGWHIVGGLEQREDPVSIGFRAGYYSVAYELKSVTENGVSLPLNAVRSEFRSPSGNGFNLTLYLGFFL